VIRVASAVILDAHGHVLVQKRHSRREFPEHWEFPGGKVEAWESPQHACERELMEELNLRVLVWPRSLITVAFNRPLTVEAFDVSLYLCKLQPEDQTPVLNDAVEVGYYPFGEIPLPMMPSLHVFLAYLHQAGGVEHLRVFAETE
jgi:mutator protein MutT